MPSPFPRTRTNIATSNSPFVWFSASYSSWCSCFLEYSGWNCVLCIPWNNVYRKGTSRLRGISFLLVHHAIVSLFFALFRIVFLFVVFGIFFQIVTMISCRACPTAITSFKSVFKSVNLNISLTKWAVFLFNFHMSTKNQRFLKYLFQENCFLCSNLRLFLHIIDSFF